MNKKPTYEHIFNLLDFADDIVERIDNIDNGTYDSNFFNYFLTLVYIEDILDTYGRGLVRESADQNGKDGHSLMASATQRMDNLRKYIKTLTQANNVNDALEAKTESFKRDWKWTAPGEEASDDGVGRTSQDSESQYFVEGGWEEFDGMSNLHITATQGDPEGFQMDILKPISKIALKYGLLKFGDHSSDGLLNVVLGAKNVTLNLMSPSIIHESGVSNASYQEAKNEILKLVEVRPPRLEI